MKLVVWLNFVIFIGLIFISAGGLAKPLELLSSKPEKSWSIKAPNPEDPRFDPSGLMRYEGHFLVVSDRWQNSKIYKLEVGDAKTFQAQEFIPLKHYAHKKTDLEGICTCRGKFLLVDEETQSILEVDQEGNVKSHFIDIRPIHRERKFALPLGTFLAGLEGVACDEANGRIFVAYERDFRMLYEVNLNSWKVTDFFDVPAGWNLPRRSGEFYIGQDYADLQFANGYLYALQRNDRTLLKIDPKTKSLVSTLKLRFDENDLYENNEPYGMAEGLLIEQNKIYIVLDNNGMKQKHSPSIDGIMMQFARPKGF